MASTPKDASATHHGLHLTTAATADPKGGHSAFPPFDAATFAPQLVWLAITFAALYFIMSRMALPRIASVIAERRERIQRDLSEAERLKAETDAALAAYEKSLADARGRAQAMAKDVRDSVAAETDRQRRKSDDENAARIAATEKAISENKGRALANVDQAAADTAAAIIERLIGQQVGTDELRKALAGQRSGPTS